MRLARAIIGALALVVAVGLVVGAVRGRGGRQDGASSTPSASARPTTAATTGPTGTSSPTPVPSSAVPVRGSGTFTPVDAPGPASDASGRVVRYSLEVEDGLDVDRATFARTVHDTLLDPRSWQPLDHVRFVAVPAAEVAAGARVDVRVSLATPATVDRLCAPLRTRGQVSCHNGGRVVLNLLRWQTGAPAFGSDLAQYRLYLVNHEVGHAIGHGHRQCPEPGTPAPVMVQQTIGLQGCTANPWPQVTRG